MPATEAAQRARRVFFALWPDAATATRLGEAGRQLHGLCGGRLIAPDMLHMTLLFLGNVPGERLDGLREAAAGVAGAACSVRFDRWACWRRKQLAWIGCHEPPSALSELVEQLAARLSEAGVPLEQRSFMAHVTLLRKANCVALPQLTEFLWPVSEFVLAESKLSAQGSHYRVIGRWPLTPGTDGTGQLRGSGD